MTLESTLAALLREQRETNALLRRLVEAMQTPYVPRAPSAWPQDPVGYPLSRMTGDPLPPRALNICGSPTVTTDAGPAVSTWSQHLPLGTFVTPTCESPATRGDGGAIRVGWQGNGMVGP